MSWFEEVKPPFLVARAYGVAPYSFTKGVIANSRIFRILSFFLFAYRICECSFYVYRNVISETYLQLKILLITQSLLRSSSWLVKGFACLRSPDDLKISIKYIEKYDNALRINFASKSVVVRAWLKIAVTAFYLLSLSILRPTNSRWKKIMSFYRSIDGIGSFTMVFKFLDVLSSLNRRFQHLGNILTEDVPCMIYDVDGTHRSIRLEDIRHLHENLILAARKFNSIHNGVLFIWIVESSVFATVKIYTFLTDNTSDTFYESWHTYVHLMPDITFIIYLFITCHGTAVMANRVGWVALSPRSCVLRGRFIFERDEGFVTAQSFALNHLHFTAAYGLFRIELPLLGTIFGAVTTYLVIACNS